MLVPLIATYPLIIDIAKFIGCWSCWQSVDVE
jgi:hypothetical protein